MRRRMSDIVFTVGDGIWTWDWNDIRLEATDPTVGRDGVVRAVVTVVQASELSDLPTKKRPLECVAAARRIIKARGLPTQRGALEGC